MCMEGFSVYYMRRMLEEDGVLSESSDVFDAGSFVRKNRKKSSVEAHVRKFSEKYPSVQRCEVEDVVLKALKEVSKKKPGTEAAAKRLLKKQADSMLAKIKKASGKNLSCLKAIKSSSSDLEGMIAKAGRILTANERKALDMCSKGSSVRKIGELMGLSFPTAWRILNLAIDKVRISHGMKSRHMDRR